MTVKDLIKKGDFKLLNEGNHSERKITQPYCCDLLSVAMAKMPSGSLWVTVMGNMNTLAVAALTDAAGVLLAEGGNLDEAALNKAKEQGITVLFTELPIFQAAQIVYNHIHA